MKATIRTDAAARMLKRAIPSMAKRRAFLREVASAGEAHWKNEALQKLRATSRDYVNGIQQIKTKRSIEIELTGMLPNMVENGWPGGDMRLWMLRSPKTKVSKKGNRYLVVPFRHGTPGTSGRNVGREMPSAIHAAAKRLSATTTEPDGGKTRWGDRLREVKGMRRTTRELLTRKDKPWHSTSLYRGMVRNEKLYQTRKQSSYTTFRVISARSKDPRSWFHNGIRARRFAVTTQQYVGRIISEVAARRLMLPKRERP